MRAHLFLIAAVAAEVIATTALARSNGFTRLWPSVVCVVGYALAFWLLAEPLKTIPTGVVYAIWSGLGVVLIALVGWLWSGQVLDLPALLGLALILAGVLVINLFSHSVSH